MDATVAQLRNTVERHKQKEQRLRTTVTVLLSRSENQILVLETLLKRLVQVCVHTQDRRLAKELKLIDFTRLAKRLSVDHMQLRQLIGSDECLDSRYTDPAHRRGGPMDDIVPQQLHNGSQGFQRDQTQMATTSGRMTPDAMNNLRGDPGSHDSGGMQMNNLWNGDGMSMPMQQMGAYNGGVSSMNSSGQMMGSVGDRRPGNLSLSAQHGGMRDNPGGYFHG